MGRGDTYTGERRSKASLGRRLSGVKRRGSIGAEWGHGWELPPMTKEQMEVDRIPLYDESRESLAP